MGVKILRIQHLEIYLDHRVYMRCAPNMTCYMETEEKISRSNHWEDHQGQSLELI